MQHAPASAPETAATDTTAGLDGVPWDDLLAYLDDRRVIPVLDAGALQVGEGAAREPLESLLARRLAERLRIDVGPGPLRLDEVVRRQRAGGRRENLHLRLQQLLRELDLAPPPALLELASIDALDLFVSLSFDDLLARALDQVRHGGAARSEVIAFAPNRSPDLARPRRDGPAAPTVFQLLGRLSSSANESVICDDDRLEFLHALQDDARRPKLLFDELRDAHLLLLGCRLPDWAARFFLRTARGERLSMPGRDTIEVLVGRELADDAPLAGFLAAFRPDALLVPAAPEAFIGELARRWRAAHPAAAPAAAAAGPAPAATPPDAAVFVSYNRADGDAAARLVERLRGAGVDVWFDRNDIRYGDPWAERIVAGIEQAALFIPVISAHTQSEDRSRAYFWREWNMAAELAAGMAPSEVFVLPVVVDDTEPYRANVPRRFLAASMARFPGGEPDAAFVEQVMALAGAYRRRIGHG